MKRRVSFVILWLTCSFSLVWEQSRLYADQAGLLDRLEHGISYYESLKDYKAIFHKTEKSKGVVGETEKIYLKFEKPWKIYMGWLNTDKKGLQVVYEKGQNDDKLVIHKPGLFLGMLPLIFLDKNSPWVSVGSESYDIEDAGLGTFLYDFRKAVLRAVKEEKLKVRDLEEGKTEVIFEGTQKNKDYFAYRIIVSFDKENNLPLHMELFDWQNELIGIYSYNEFEANTGNDAEFRSQAHRQLFKIYTHDAG